MVCIGNMRERVEIQHALETQSASGEVDHAWKCLASVWAEVLPLTARERLTANAVEEETTHKVTIRHRNDVDSKNRLVWRGSTLDISGSINVDGRFRYLTLMCKEVG